MRVEELRAVREMGARHAAAATKLIDKGLAALAKVKLDEMSVADILRYITDGAKLERLARGQPENVGPFGNTPVAPQDTIRSMMESDPEVARAAARFSAQILRYEREQQEASERGDS